MSTSSSADQPRRSPLPPRQPRKNYLNASYSVALVAVDHRPQADRHSLPDAGDADVLHRRAGHLDRPAESGDARRRPGRRRHLQQALHDPRRHHGVLLPRAGDPDRAGKFLPADDDRRQGPGLSAAQPAELVSVHARRRLDRCRRAGRRRRYRLDLLHALQLARRRTTTSC